MDTESLGETLRRWRKRRGVTLEQVFHATGLKIAYISKLERGILPPPRVDTFFRLMRVYGVSSDEAVCEVHRATTRVSPR